MEIAAMARSFVLPRELPEGTRYVVEGRPTPEGTTRIVSRYLVFPDGRRVDLPAMPRFPAAAIRKRRRVRNHARSLKTARARPFLLQ
ncbi:MAG: hypothetical protein KJZ73_09710 [Pseudorhodoplanes sp.]|nr:hypothetical protein [Pseudorhodoplanes sp.]GIK81209.1 MAG: hypothetical protein BroJett024_23140 [Alphaproteobacteria bacterium]